MTDKENNFARDINVPSKEQTNDSFKNSDKNFNENCTHNKEQIIIDGVYINACLVSEKCKEFETCNIKNILRQLARKTQECEGLKGKYKNVLDIAKQNADANEYCLQELEQENYRYRKAFEEIEGLVQNVEADECLYGDFDCNNCDSDNLCATKVKRLILDIISKVKGKE